MQVIGAIAPAFERTKRAMFQPFDIGRWLAFGFVFFVASLIDPIGGYSGRMNFPRRPSGGVTLPEIELPPEIADHWNTILIAGGLALVVATVAGIALAWVGARGLMMTYRSVASGFVAIGESWRETAKPANALFGMSIAVSAIGAVFALPLLALGIFQARDLYVAGERDAAVMLRAIFPFLLGLGAIGFAGAIVGFVIRQFIAPFLLFFPVSVREAWSRFFAVLRSNPLGVLGFLAARIVIAFVVALISSIVSTCTCCIGGLPILHQTVLAPVLFFDRAFTLHVLASIAPEYASLWQR